MSIRTVEVEVIDGIDVNSDVIYNFRDFFLIEMAVLLLIKLRLFVILFELRILIPSEDIYEHFTHMFPTWHQTSVSQHYYFEIYYQFALQSKSVLSFKL